MPTHTPKQQAGPDEITLKSVIFSFDYGFTQKLIRGFALVSVFGQIAFYFLCKYGFGMRESLPLRLLAAALSAGALLLPADRPLRTHEKIYWEVVANLMVVSMFAHLFILNDMNTYWYISLMFGALVYAFVARPLSLVIFLPVGLAVPTLLWSVNRPFSSAELLRMGQAYATCLITGVAMVGAAASIEWSFRRTVASEARLREAQAKLLESEKMSALGRLLAQFSHEINNPVNVIKNNIPPMREYLTAVRSMLEAYGAAAGEHMGSQASELRRVRAELDIDFIVEDFGEALDVSELATRRIEAIQSDLRTFMRGEVPAWSTTDLNEQLKETVLIVQRTLPAGVTIRAEYGDVQTVVCRAGRMNQVFLNLIQNAIDAVGTTGEIVVKTRPLDGGIRFEISNTGPLIPEGIRQRIFEPFFTTKEVGKGTGLGLSVCRQIVVEDHAGAIELEAAYVDGARFVVVLPTDPRRTNWREIGASLMKSQ